MIGDLPLVQIFVPDVEPGEAPLLRVCLMWGSLQYDDTMVLDPIHGWLEFRVTMVGLLGLI